MSGNLIHLFANEDVPVRDPGPLVSREQILAVAKAVGAALESLSGDYGMVHHGRGKPKAWVKHGKARWYFEVTTTWWEGRTELNRFYVDLLSGAVGLAPPHWHSRTPSPQIVSGLILDHLNRQEFPTLTGSSQG